MDLYQRLIAFFDSFKQSVKKRDESIKSGALNLKLRKVDEFKCLVLNLENKITRLKLAAALEYRINYTYIRDNIRYSVSITFDGSYYIESKNFIRIKEKEFKLTLFPLSLSFEFDLYDIIKDFDILKESPAHSLFLLLLDKEKLSFRERLKRLESPSLFFIWGPPGTGKTNDIVKKAKELIKKGERVLITAANNLSLDDINKKLLDSSLLTKRIGEGRLKKEDAIKKELDSLTDGSVVLMTVAKALIEAKNVKEKFSTIILDEAGIVKDRFILSLSFLCSKCLYIYGDHKQLAPVDERSESTMIFDLLNIRAEDENIAHPYFKMLDKEYRMNSQINKFISQAFYSGKLKKGKRKDEKLEKSELDKLFPDDLNLLDLSPYAVYDFKYNRSYMNFTSSFFSVMIAALYLKKLKNKNTIAIASAYHEDAILMRTIASDVLSKEELNNVIIDTVHAFQGKEADIMILSLCDAKPLKKLSNLLSLYDNENRKGPSDRLINVAVSRSRIKFILVSDFEFLEKYKEKGTSLEILLSEIDRPNLKLKKRLKMLINMINLDLKNKTEVGLFGNTKDKSKMVKSSQSSWSLRKEFNQNEKEYIAYISSSFSMTSLRQTLFSNISRYKNNVTLRYSKGRFKISENKAHYFFKIEETEDEIPFAAAFLKDDLIYGLFYSLFERGKGKTVPYIRIKNAKHLKMMYFR